MQLGKLKTSEMRIPTKETHLGPEHLQSRAYVEHLMNEETRSGHEQGIQSEAKVVTSKKWYIC